jgi:type III pantothenate kinase
MISILILTIDIGNTTTVFGLFEKDRLVWRGYLPTDASRPARMAADWLTAELASRHHDPATIAGTALASVVPAATAAAGEAVRLVCGKEPLQADRRNIGLALAVDQPETVGTDRLVCALAASSCYASPLAVIDLGTATTISILDQQGRFIGGMISPGLQTAADALHQAAAQLPALNLASISRQTASLPLEIPLIGASTAACIRSGLIRGAAAMIDSLSDQIEVQLGRPVSRIVTGGLAGLVLPFCRSRPHHEPDLILQGLKLLAARELIG